MTSTSFNVGLNDNTRVSSRVLRPPGGGHTDIFGEAEPQLPTSRRGPPQSTGIAACVSHEETKPNGQATEAPTQNGQNGQVTPQEPPAPIPGPEPKQSSQVKPEPANPPPKVEAPKRIRVPPGGFSSGLW